ncbi:TPA: hypothetical protein ACMDSN_001264 [Vibrio cholerae]
MKVLSTSSLRYITKMNVTNDMIARFEKEIKSVHSLKVMDTKTKKIILMMERYLRVGYNSAKKDRICNVLAQVNNVQLSDSINITESSVPCRLSLLESGVSSGTLDKYDGTHRVVYIDKETGFGIKVMKKESTWGQFKDWDIRLNALYKDEMFYSGKYAEFGCYKTLTIIDDMVDNASRAPISVTYFRKIPNAEKLRRWDQVPLSTLLTLESMGYQPFDIKPDNFVKIINGDNYDYLPIDAKLIGKLRSNSVRSIRVRDLREQQGPYCYSGKYVDVAK